MRKPMLRGFWGCLVISGFFVVQIEAQEAGKIKPLVPAAGIAAQTNVSAVIPSADIKPTAPQPALGAPVVAVKPASMTPAIPAKPLTPTTPSAVPKVEPQKTVAPTVGVPVPSLMVSKPTQSVPPAAAPVPIGQASAITSPAASPQVTTTPVVITPDKPVAWPTAPTPVIPVTTPVSVVPVPVTPTPAVPVEVKQTIPVAPAAPLPSESTAQAQMVKEPSTLAPLEMQQTTMADESVASEQFDTSKVKEYGGNWYFKRAWWQNAEGEYEKARQILESLFEARMAFFEKRNELERTLFEPFYRNIGFEQGELQDTLVYLIDQIETEREEEGALDIKEREFLSTIQEEKKTLEQLKLDMEQLSKFDDAIDDAVNILIKQINQARQYEKAAWKEFKAIAEELSDIKARERYYTIRTLYKDIKNIYDYIRGDFKKYFDNLEDVSRKEAERIKSSIKTLKNKGIDLKIEAKKLAEEPLKTTPAPSPAPVKVEEEAESGYIMRTIYWIGGFARSSWNLIFGWIYRF